MGTRCQSMKTSRTGQADRHSDLVLSSTALALFRRLWKSNIQNQTEQSGASKSPPVEAITADKRWQPGAVLEGGICHRYLSCLFFVGNWGRRKEEGGKRRARDLHPRAQMAPRVMTATPPRSLSPQLGPWRRLSVKMKNGSEVLFSFAFDFSVTIGLTFPCLYNACWIYCISHSICLGEIGLNLKKAPQSKSNEYSQMPAVVDKSTNPW